MDVHRENKDVRWVGLHLLTKATNLSSSPLRLWQKKKLLLFRQVDYFSQACAEPSRRSQSY
jgi:hypothetical protein